MSVTVELYCEDCLEVLPTLPDATVDAMITDPPYPEISRPYGRWTVDEWWALMRPVVVETRRILKPTGSAVFILQPNSEHVGQMRGWLWEFMAWICRDWNIVQDVWWWNISMLPTTHCNRWNQLMRPSVKACVWCGPPDCYRRQLSVLWEETARNAAMRASHNRTRKMPSGASVREKRCGMVAEERGGVTPYNVLPIAAANSQTSAGAHGHGAGTPLKLADWWTRYICPPGGTVADWFMGSGTMGVAAVQNGCSFIGIEKTLGLGYFKTAQERIEVERAKAWQTEMALEC